VRLFALVRTRDRRPVLARERNSGSPGTPHMETHLRDSPELNCGEGILVKFCNYLAYDLGGDSHSAHLSREEYLPAGGKKQIVHQLDP
jgi:hypothetical protein